MRNNLMTENHIKSFEKYLYENEKSDITVKKYLCDIKKFSNYIGKGAVEKADVLSYKEELLRKYSASSANSMLAALNSFFRFLGCIELCVKQFKIQKKIYCTEEKELSKAEYIRLVKSAEKRKKNRLSLLLQTICGTGIRVSELAFITVEAVKRGEAVVSCKGKTRNIFIVSSLRKKLLEYSRKHNLKSGIIFTTKSGKPLDRSNIWREMKSVCEEANVSKGKVFPHNLRHLFAREFYRIENDIAKLADILGHSSINTTRIYIITTGKEHRRRMENMNLIL